jgi:hypothetical protein
MPSRELVVCHRRRVALGGRPAQEGAHRDAIDVARALALFVVVLGHLLLAVIDRPDGEVRGANLLALHPGWAIVATLAPMPVFFAAAGWANATATPASAAARLRTLVGLGAVVVCAWSLAVLVATWIAGDPGVVADGGRIATQPLWFVAAYAPLAAAGGLLARSAATHPVRLIGGALALLAALDAARFGFGAPDWIGWPGFYLAWATPWLVGGWWRDRASAGSIDERRTGWLLAGVGGAGAAALVALAGYDPALIDAVEGARSNTTPPTLYTAVAALAQVGLLMAGAGALDRAGRRWRRLWDRAGEAAVGVYAWHLTALALCGAAVAAGFPVPERLTTLWWLTRPLWWGAVLALTLLFVLTTAAVRARLTRGRSATSPLPAAQLLLGVFVSAGAGAIVGLRGPRSTALAITCAALFGGGWALLRPRSAQPARDWPPS